MLPKEIIFPHETLRKGQDKLVEDIYETLTNKKILLADAPTGLGKTASAISVALSIALKEDKKVFFLTNRHTQHKIAIDTLKLLQKKSQQDFVCVDLIGKKWMCNQEVANLFGNDFNEYCKTVIEKGECEYYNNFKTKKGITVEGKLAMELMRKKEPMSNEEIKIFSEQNKICAHELAMAVAKKAQVIIGDYFYLFNPRIQETILKKMDIELDKVILIVDEAHNLPNRIADMMSQKLTSVMLKRGVMEAEKFRYDGLVFWLNSLKNIIEKLSGVNTKQNNSFESSKKNQQSSLFSTAYDLKSKEKNNPNNSSSVPNKTSSYTTSYSNKEKLIRRDTFISEVKLITDYDELIEELNSAADEVRKKQKRSQLGGIASFLDAWQGSDDGFIRIISQNEGKYGKFISLQYSCLDPSLVSKNVFEEIDSAVLMSGTLNPTSMYRDLLSIKNSLERKYSSPFPPENRMSIIIPETSTKYDMRNEKMYKEIGTKCSQICEVVPGNVAFFFPSYWIRDKVYPFIKIDKEIFLEKQDMTKEDKEKFLVEFKEGNVKGGALLGVAGANFAEGIDLPGDFLQTVVIVGLPLASPDLKTKETIKYYDNKFDKGWDYAYLFPAMNKCLQSAGRCIRSGTDIGAIVYLEERFAWKRYYDHLPKERLIVTKNFYHMLEKFFRKY
ncbi:ATP-dependent DNA helicase [archaeon]|jgi:DNA excision repair protein ERCC-2|nr:ATP-dependent DNA helicase [archaeon]MBT3450652.1 ATP-dependent DNA helicase [archaeon]MBT6868768.1 ATP-dependent DNA helicase [archaeon]MBT7193011.1 ATP-dependent DNA helicase [archaeon]MBT7380977.1 ATP-dependent DNA helicase [archaeon]